MVKIKLKNLFVFWTAIGILTPTWVMATDASDVGVIFAFISDAMSITEIQPLNFGTITNENSYMGVTPDGFRYTYGNNLVNDNNLPTQGIFSINGAPNRSITILLPQSAVTLSNGKGNNIYAWLFTSQGQSINTTLNSAGSYTLNVAGELSPEGVPGGNYSGTYTITVIY